MKFTDAQLALKAIAYRRRILEIIKHAGAGHTGGSLSCVDILNVLYNRILAVSPQTFSDPARDRYIQSKGHSVEALYVVLADRGFFPSTQLDTLCAYQSHFVGHPTRKVPGIEQNTGALGHGLPIAVGTAIAAKKDASSFRVFSLLGDGELAEGSNWEAAMAAAHYRLDNLIAIVDHNTLQISGRTRDVCSNEPLDEKFRAFGWAVKAVDGHSIPQLTESLSPREPDGKPLALIANTVKGKGVSFMEDVVKWHHGVPTDAEYTAALKELDETFAAAQKENRLSAPAPSMYSKAAGEMAARIGLKLGRPNLEEFGSTLLELAKANRQIIAVTTDSRGSGKLVAFGQALPEQIVELGIAEQNLVGVAAGIASVGKIVYAVSPACFLTARALEQIKNDVAYSNNPVKLIGISAGVSYGALGSTHHSLHDLAALRAINNIDIIVPADNFEAREAIKAATSHPRPMYIRFGKAPLYDLGQSAVSFEIGKSRMIRDGSDITFIATGETVIHALLAAGALADEKLSCRVISMHTIKPLDREAILQAAGRCRVIVTVEEHSVFGGLGEACAAVLLEAGAKTRFKIVAIPDEYTTTGSQADIFRHYGISMEGLAGVARNLAG